MYNALEWQLKNTLNTIGYDVKINNKPARVIIKNLNKTFNNEEKYDDKEIISPIQLKRGQYIKYNDLYFIVLNEVNDIRFKTYYKAVMRRCSFNIKFVHDGQLYLYYSIIDSDKFSINESKLINTLADTLTVTLPLTNTSKNIKVGIRFIKFGRAWEITGLDYTQDGLIILHCDVDSFDPNTDDKENEIADRYNSSGNDLLNGNIEPILPYIENAPTHNVIFYTIDNATQENIESGTVLLTDTEGLETTLTVGQFYEIVSGLYTYTVNVEGYKVVTDTIDIQADTTKFIFLEVKPPTYNITFNVTPADAIITLKDNTDTVIDPISSGVYEVESGTYTYSVAKEGYIISTGTINVVDIDIIESVELVEDIPVGDNYELIINGQDSIMMMQSATYTIKTYNNGIETGHTVTFSIDNTSLATISSQNGRSCTVASNTNFNSGEFKLKATLDDDVTVFVERTLAITGF